MDLVLSVLVLPGIVGLVAVVLFQHLHRDRPSTPPRERTVPATLPAASRLRRVH